MIPSRLVTWRDSLIAASMASAPEFWKTNVSSPAGSTVPRNSASRMLASYEATPLEMCMSFPACSVTAFTTRG